MTSRSVQTSADISGSFNYEQDLIEHLKRLHEKYIAERQLSSARPKPVYDNKYYKPTWQR